MIRHIVMLSLKDDAQLGDLQDVMTGLDRLRAVVPGFVSFDHGPNKDFEEKSPDYPYGFICTFTDKNAVQTYANNPDHKRLGARLVALCIDGADGIWVADIETG